MLNDELLLNRKRHHRWIALVAVVAGAGGYLWLVQRSDNTGDDLQTAAAEPLIVTIGYGRIENAIPAAGSLRPREIISVKAPVSGELVEIYAEVGDVVEAGQPLALIDADLEPEDVEVPALLSGTIVAADLKRGAILMTSQAAPTILQLADLATLTVETEVSEVDIAALEDGIGVYFTTLGTGDRRWYGDLRQVLLTPTTRNGIVFYTTRFDVDNTEGKLYPGMTTQVYFITSFADDVLTVPVGALSFTDAAGGNRSATVEAVGADGSTETRRITVGAMDRINAEVVSGLAAGDRVVAGIILPQVEIEDPQSSGR